MYLAGLRVPHADVEVLAALVDEPTRTVLAKALTLGTKVVALTVPNREQILRALDDPPTDALAELRGVLSRLRGSASSPKMISMRIRAEIPGRHPGRHGQT